MNQEDHSKHEEHPKILIVDDSRSGRLFLANIIRNNTPYEVFLASDGISVIKNIDTIRPDLILMDILMPIMDGLETTRRIKAMNRYSKTPIIFLSSMEGEDDIVNGFDAGGSDYITKPYKKRVVLSRINALLERKQYCNLLKKLSDDMNYDLEIAGEIQKSAFCIEKKTYRHMRIQQTFIPLAKVSGDFYDIVSLPDNRILVFVADVTGHGVPAALYTMMLKMLMNQIKGHNAAIGRIMREINNSLCSLLLSDIFITASAALVDFNKKEIQYSNGAHPPAFFHRKKNNQIVELSNQNIILGYHEVEDDFVFQTLSFDYGDKLLLFTDGIFEHESKENRPLGTAFVREFFKENIALSGTDFNNKLSLASLGCSSNKQFNDDVTLLHIEFIE